MVGTKVNSSTGIAADRRVDNVHYNEESGVWVAWCCSSDGAGEHVIAKTKSGLFRKLKAMAKEKA